MEILLVIVILLVVLIVICYLGIGFIVSLIFNFWISLQKEERANTIMPTRLFTLFFWPIVLIAFIIYGNEP